MGRKPSEVNGTVIQTSIKHCKNSNSLKELCKANNRTVAYEIFFEGKRVLPHLL